LNCLCNCLLHIKKQPFTKRTAKVGRFKIISKTFLT